MKKIIYPLMICFICCQSIAQISCKDCNSGKCATVTFTVTYEGQVIYVNKKIPWVKGMDVTVVMINAASGSPLTVETKPFCPYGNFVNGFNGHAAQNGFYWALYKNGIYAQLGIDFLKVNAGDSVRYSYISYTSLKNQLAATKSSKASMREASLVSTPTSQNISHQTLYFMNEESLRK